MKIPHHPYFLFGMGNRRKLLYKGGALFDALTGEILRSWNPIQEQILPQEFKVKWQTREGRQYSLEEDENAVTLKVEGTHTILTAGPINMPEFQGSGHAAVMKVLLHEVLINVVEGKPLTNLLVQSSPSYRDAAVICEALRQTGNLGLVKDWILALPEAYDYATGQREADNLGQALFLLSLVSNKEHPLVAKIVHAAGMLRKFDYIEGRTEGGEHPVYQTKWLKAMGLANRTNVLFPDLSQRPASLPPWHPRATWRFAAPGGSMGTDAVSLDVESVAREALSAKVGDRAARNTLFRHLSPRHGPILRPLRQAGLRERRLGPGGSAPGVVPGLRRSARRLARRRRLRRLLLRRLPETPGDRRPPSRRQPAVDPIRDRGRGDRRSCPAARIAGDAQ